MNNGIDEHEQNGVSVPSNAPTVFALSPRMPPRIRRVRSGGKWLCTHDTAKISTASSRKILIVS